MLLVLAHNEDGCVVLGCVRERRPPFSPENAVAELAVVLSSYGLPYGIAGLSLGGRKPTGRTSIVCIGVVSR